MSETQTDLKAGRELDALVAEKVMGWRYTQVAFTNAPGQFGWECDGPNGEAHFSSSKHAPPFSTDIAAAWEVMAKVRTLPIGQCQDFTQALAGLGGKAMCEAIEWLLFECDNVPESICLAALKAVGA